MPTKIEWARNPDGSRGESWNPIRARNRETGGLGHFCIHASEGCRFCYAERLQPRFQNPIRYAAQDADAVEIEMPEEIWTAPTRWRRPRTVFVCSMTDLFLELHTDAQIDNVFAVMAACPEHTFQVLTKRPARARAYLTGGADKRLNKGGRPPDQIPWPLPNVWVGTSAEDQPTAKRRLAELEHVPAAIRFVSLEPLIESVDLNMLGCDAIKWLDWVIVGGESGPKSRPMHPQWARWIRDTCAEYDVPFFFKQHGDWRHALNWGHFLGHRRGVLLHIDGTPVDGDPDMMWDDRTVAKMIRLGKKTAGRKLDGLEYNEMPG